MSNADNPMQGVINALKAGFGTLTEEVRGTNQRLDETNQRLGRLEAEVGSIKDEVGSIKDEVGSIKDEVGSIKVELSTFRREVGERFDGVGSYLRAINGTLAEHSERIFGLEKRVSKLEGGQGAA